VVVIGVHCPKFTSEQDTENLRQAIMRHEIEHPVVNDAGFEIWQSYTVRAWPTIVVIDPKGKIVASQSGEIDVEEYVPMLERLVTDFETQGLLDRRPLELKPEAQAEPPRLFNYPSKIHVSPDGRFFVADTGHHRIIELKLEEDGLTGQVQKVFGCGRPDFEDGPAETAAFNNPRGMAFLNNSLYVADTDNHAIRAIDLDTGQVRTVAGTGRKGAGRLPGPTPLQTDLRSPWALCAVEDATRERKPVLFIAMAGSHQIWLLFDESQIGVFAGNGREALVDGPVAEASFNQPSDLALGMNHLLVADPEASAIRGITLSEELRVISLVGEGLFEFGDKDGIGTEARLQHPTGLAFADSILFAVPTLFIADSYNHKIKTLDPSTGRVQTLIGTGQPGLKDGEFKHAGLYQPEGVAFYKDKLYIADTNNHLIRVADFTERRLVTLAVE
jgi:sugar lactone lactonase YvrE